MCLAGFGLVLGILLISRHITSAVWIGIFVKNPCTCVETYYILRTFQSHWCFGVVHFQGVCYVNHSNYAFIFNLKLSIIPQHSNEKYWLIEDSNFICNVHQRSAFCFGYHGDLTFFLLIFMEFYKQPHTFFIFSNKSEPQKVFILMIVHQLWVAVRQWRPQRPPNIWHMVERRILFWFLIWCQNRPKEYRTKVNVN